MDEQVDNKLLEKIQKLLRLQQGAEAIGSLEEAKNAATRVTELLLKYNLDLEDVTGFVKPDEKDIRRFNEREIENPKNEGQWIFKLYNTISKFNFCKMVVTQPHGGKPWISLIGTKVNVEAVKFIADQLESRIRTAEKKAWSINTSTEKRNAFRRGFFSGAVTGIYNQLEEKRNLEARANAKVTALVLSHDFKMKSFLDNEFGPLTNVRRTSRLSAVNGHHLGYQEGRSMNINKGVTGSSDNTKQLR